MARVLALGGGAIVAGSAGTRSHVTVTHGGWCPRGGAVAGVAGRGSRNVARILALCHGAIVAGGARTRSYAAMVKSGRYPAAGTVTSIATRRRWNMVCIFGPRSHPVT